MKNLTCQHCSHNESGFAYTDAGMMCLDCKQTDVIDNTVVNRKIADLEIIIANRRVIHEAEPLLGWNAMLPAQQVAALEAMFAR